MPDPWDVGNINFVRDVLPDVFDLLRLGIVGTADSLWSVVEQITGGYPLSRGLYGMPKPLKLCVASRDPVRRPYSMDAPARFTSTACRSRSRSRAV